MYIEDKYAEIINSDGNKEYWLQPFIKNETNTIIFESMTNDRYNIPGIFNRRFYYDKKFEQGVEGVKYNSLEEIKEQFDMLERGY